MSVNFMVADDCPDFAPSFVRTLERDVASKHLDVRIELVTTAAAARAPATRPDGALVDLRLAGASGMDVIRGWRASRRLRNVPARIITSASIDDISAECDLLDAPALSKIDLARLVEAAMAFIERLAAHPRSAADERRRFADTLAKEAKLGDALRDVLVRKLANESNREIARARGTCVPTVKRQCRHVADALREVGIEVTGNLSAALLTAMVDERYDE